MGLQWQKSLLQSKFLSIRPKIFYVVLSECPIQWMSLAKYVSQLAGKANFSPNSDHTNKGVIERVGGFGYCGSLVLVFPSSSITRAKGQISDGVCGLWRLSGKEIREVTLSPFSQSSLSATPPSPVLEHNSLLSSTKTLPNSVQMSQSPYELLVLP